MKGFAITQKGCEQAAVLDVKELILAKNVTSENTTVLFDIKSHSDLAKLCYLGRAFRHVCLYMNHFAITDNVDSLVKAVILELEKHDLDVWFKDRSFRAFCEREGTHSFTSQDVAEGVGSYLGKKYGRKCDLKKPEASLFVYVVDSTCYLGIDFAGFDLGKRSYKIFLKPGDMNGVVAYSVLRLAKYKSGMMILDPFCGNATIAIEAGLYAKGKSVHFYNKDSFAFHKFVTVDLNSFDEFASVAKDSIIAFDNQLANVKASQKNAKIAGCEDVIRTGRVDIEWLDTKLSEGEVDLVVSSPPFPSHAKTLQQIEKLYKELFYQLAFVVKKNGVLCFVAQVVSHIPSLAKDYEVVLEHSLMQGKQEMKMLVLKRK